MKQTVRTPKTKKKYIYIANYGNSVKIAIGRSLLASLLFPDILLYYCKPTMKLNENIQINEI